jgi:hypothetical protein
MQTVYQPATLDAAGQIMKVKELVDVQEVEEKMTKEQMREARRPDPGFWVERRAGDLRPLPER